MALQLIMKFMVAGAIRYVIMKSQYRQSISDHVEISTPLNSWKRVTEAAFLISEQKIDPYVGDTFHDSPLNLQLYGFIINRFSNFLPIVFILCDILSAGFLYKTAIRYMSHLKEKQNAEKNVYSKDAACLLLKDEDFSAVPKYVLTAYLFNPYVMLNCIGMTTTTFTNLFLSLALYGMVNHYRIFNSVCLALATSQTLYPAVLIVPMAIYEARKKATKKDQIRCFVVTILIFICSLCVVLFISYRLCKNVLFIQNTFGFILNVDDLHPNIGLTWYFFTEMFDHFRLLFICAFQINVLLLYLVPLSLRLREDPMLLAVSLTAITTMFRTYPSLGDVGFYLSLFPMWKHLFPFMQQCFVVGNIFMMTSVIAPIFWNLWIYSGAANANYYFGVTLIFIVAQIFLLTDILFAYVKREFFLKQGFIKEIDGKRAELSFE